MNLKQRSDYFNMLIISSITEVLKCPRVHLMDKHLAN